MTFLWILSTLILLKNFSHRFDLFVESFNQWIYDPCWLQIINAVATLIELESEYVFAALDARITDGENERTDNLQSNYRDEPVAFFFGIYGLCFQTLLRVINRDDSEAKCTISVVLDALRKFLRPSVSGNAMYKGFVFAETTDLLDRLVLLESPDIQLTVIQIAANLAKYHPEGMHSQSNGWYNPHPKLSEHCSRHITRTVSARESAEITDGVEQLLDLVHILILALNQNAAWLSDALPRCIPFLTPWLILQLQLA